MLIGTITTNTQVIVGEIQQVGARGYSAYQLALMEVPPFTGTYEQWRDSLKGDQGDPVPVANTLGQSETIAVSQKLLTDTVDVMQSDNAQAVQRAETAAGNAEGFATTAGQQAGLAEGYKNAAGVSAQEAADTAAGLTASVNALLADKQDSASLGSAAFADVSSFATAAQGLLAENAQPKEDGKGLSEENYTLAEKEKLSGVAVEATKNRADILNADKVHEHDINDVTGLSTRLNDIDALIGDVESVLIAINGEP